MVVRTSVSVVKLRAILEPILRDPSPGSSRAPNTMDTLGRRTAGAKGPGPTGPKPYEQGKERWAERGQAVGPTGQHGEFGFYFNFMGTFGKLSREDCRDLVDGFSSLSG